jgi:Na+-driven multidrug efflux pump
MQASPAPLTPPAMSEMAKLTRGSIRGHLVSQTMPMIFGVAAIMSVGLIDAYFIGQLGAQELAAVSFIFPITIALSSLGVGVMVGINSVIARALGEGDVPRAERRANFGAVFALGAGLVLGLGLYLLLDPLFRLMQASENLLPLIGQYMRPYALGLPIMLLQMGLNGVLRGQGEARKTSYVSLTYSVANWMLDPILITGAFGIAGFGIAGAAYATIAGFFIAILVALWLIRGAKLHIHPAAIRDCDVGASSKAILSVAAPAACRSSPRCLPTRARPRWQVSVRPDGCRVSRSCPCLPCRDRSARSLDRTGARAAPIGHAGRCGGRGCSASAMASQSRWSCSLPATGLPTSSPTIPQ